MEYIINGVVKMDYTVPDITNYLTPPLLTPGQPTSYTASPSSQPSSQSSSQVDLASLIAAINSQNSSLSESGTKVQSAYDSATEAGNQRVAAVNEAARNDSIIQTQAEVAKLAVQNKTLQVATTLGTNLDSSSELLTSVGLDMRKAYSDMSQSAAAIHQKQSVNFLDDPLSWINNKLTVDSDYENYNDAADRYNRAEEYLGNINQLTQSSAVTQNALMQSHSAATVQATSELVVNKAAEQVATIKQNNALLNVQAITAAQNVTQQQLTNSHALFSSAATAEQLQLAQKHLDLAQQTAQVSMEDKLEKEKERKLTQSDLTEISDNVNKGASILGVAPVPATKALQLMKAGGDAGDLIKQMYQIGSVSGASGKPMIARTPGKAAALIDQTNAPLIPAMTQLRSSLMQSYSEAKDAALKADKNPEWIEQKVNTTMHTLSDRFSSNITNDPANFYSAAPIPALINIGSIKDSPLYTKVLAPLKIEDSDSSKLVSITADAIKNKLITYDEGVQGLQNIYSAAIIQNNATKNFTSVGLPPQTTYNTSIASPVGTVYKYNLNSPTDVGNVLNRELQFTRTNSSFNVPFGGF